MEKNLLAADRARVRAATAAWPQITILLAMLGAKRK